MRNGHRSVWRAWVVRAGLVFSIITLLSGCQLAQGQLPAALPTAKPTGSAANPDLSLERINTTPLNNLIDENLAPAGESGGFVCMESDRLPFLSSNGVEREVGQGIGLFACGWKENETVWVSVADPQGKSSRKEYPTQFIPTLGYSFLSYFFQPALDAHPGIYHFTFEGTQDQLEIDITFKESLTPHIQLASAAVPGVGEVGQKQNTLWLYGFQANEVVRLFVFESARAAGWQDYVLNQTGRLEIPIDLPADGEWSFWGYNRQYELIPQTILNFEGLGFPSYIDLVYCPKAPPRKVISRISADPEATVAAKANPGQGKTLPIRDIPGADGTVLREVAQGETLVLNGRVSCVEDTLWWQVVLPDDAGIGWVTETVGTEYVLLPEK